MEEIKQHLESGKTVKEIVELGFKKPSIYKCRKELKDKEPQESRDPPEPQEPKPFQEENKEMPATVLVGDNPGPNNPDSSFGDLPNNQEAPDEGEGEGEGESLIEELFSDDEKPFQVFNEVDINRTHVDVGPISGLYKSETKVESPGTGQLGLNELIAQVFGTIAVATNHEHWELSSKEQKVLKHLCKIPALEKVLHKFGLYGCVLSLITITFKRIKTEMQFKKDDQEYENHDQGNSPEPVVLPDSPGTVMDLLGDKE